jgi:hypothetical protein
MSDDFIRGLKQTWQAQDHDSSRVLARLRRKRWEPHVALAGAIIGCAAALAGGIWFAWTAAHPGPQRLLFALSAAVLLTTAPAVCLATVKVLAPSLAWHDEPRMLLRMGVRRADGTLQSFRIARWHVGVIAGFVTLLWLCQVSGVLHALGFLIFYTVFCLVVCAAAWLYMMWQERRILTERAACIRLLTLMEVDEEEGRASRDEP